jgi:hypothetical protein
LSYEKLVDVTRPTPTPEKFKRIDIRDSTSPQKGDYDSTILEFQDYKLEKVTVMKTDGYDNPQEDIFDAVLSKKRQKDWEIRRRISSAWKRNELWSLSVFE